MNLSKVVRIARAVVLGNLFGLVVSAFFLGMSLVTQNWTFLIINVVLGLVASIGLVKTSKDWLEAHQLYAQKGDVEV